ncbi:MAG: glycoside hydrolase family 3 C-terminal domain-containing protein [Thermoflexales bacterium]|nr:glycoside hydrolase family 3 C-terminal domain-containing protein [Thermoflexales bacterium]
MDKDTSIKARVSSLVSQMSLAEKISQLVFDAPPIERLGIPAYNWWNECLHGLGRAGVATVFPQAIGMAASWNPDLVHRMATAISDEARAKHHEALRRDISQIYTGLTCWSPNINIFRDPRWGRGQESYGEDPYLTARLGVAFVKGLQGDHPDYLKLVATPKHFAVHSGPEPDRHHFDARVSERDLRETYLPAFEACVREGQAVSVMGAYNRTNGQPCCASFTLLEQILRQEWGFGGATGSDGYVVSDCEAIRDIFEHHRVVSTAEEAAALAVKNGCDLNCGSVYPALLQSVEQGLISEEAIDRAVERLFTARFRLGMFDPPEQVPYAHIPYEIINSPQHRALALQAARESIVLLKNEGGLLPLSKDLGAIAVVGPNADDLAVLLGNYNGTPAEALTPLAGIRHKLPVSTRVYYAPGCALADGVVPLQAVPAACLRSGAGEAGLTGEYYDNPKLDGDPILRRVDRVVDFCWKDSTPLGGRWGAPFSARWSGELIPPESGVYRLGVSGHSAYKLYLEGELLVESNSIHHPRLQVQELELEAGRLYRLRLEHVSRGLDPQVQLLWAPPSAGPTAQALEVASKADVVVAVMGLSPRLEGEEMPVHLDGFAGGDRTDIALPEPQEQLLKQLQALGKPLVLVLLNGSAVAVNWAAEHVPAIVEAWYPGQAGGEALADVLFGDYNPGGRLPVTFYKSLDDLPPFDDYAMEGHSYRYFRGEALFPFGYGLSYTTFEYGNLSITPSQARAGQPVSVSVDVRNSGDRAGDEVVQLYLRHLDTSVPRPIKELKGLKRMALEPGERKTVIFTLDSQHLGYYDEKMHYAVHPGAIELLVGSSSQHLPLGGRLEIVGKN